MAAEIQPRDPNADTTQTQREALDLFERATQLVAMAGMYSTESISLATQYLTFALQAPRIEHDDAAALLLMRKALVTVGGQK
jgi:hypothetical protein